jgi:hypothetical protein
LRWGARPPSSPDLFRGAVTEVEWMNPLRYVAEQTNLEWDQWGPVVDAASFRILSLTWPFFAQQGRS